MNKEKQIIINHITKYLEESPDLRFGQALANLGIFEYIFSEGVIQGMLDLYYVPDEEIMKRIEQRLGDLNG